MEIKSFGELDTLLGQEKEKRMIHLFGDSASYIIGFIGYTLPLLVKKR